MRPSSHQPEPILDRHPFPASESDRRQAFESICDLVYDPLQRYLRRRAAIDDSDELLDDVLLVIWTKLPLLPEDEYLPWCYGVARRILANRQRANRRRDSLFNRLAAQPRPVLLAETEIDESPELAAAFGRLAESDRDVLRLWAWEGLEAREIGIVMGVSANAASLRLTKAKKKLRSLMGGQDQLDAGHRGAEDTGEHHS